MISAVVSIPCLAIDTNTKLDAHTAAALAASEHEGQRVKAVARYVGLSHANVGDIDAHELEVITDAGLACWLVQHVRATAGVGWSPSGQMGRADGAAAEAIARAAGYPNGCHLALDLEDVRPGTSPQAVIDHCNAWSEAVDRTYSPLLYVGFQAILSPEQLYGLPGFHAYWSDYGNRKVANRGCCVQQFAPNTRMAGVMVDLDRIGIDMLGGCLTWAAKTNPEAEAQSAA